MRAHLRDFPSDARLSRGRGLVGATLVSIAVLVATLVSGGGATAAPAPRPALPSTWLCNPDMASDPCRLPTDTTDLGTGVTTPSRSVPDSDKPVDCFYVYPSVTEQFSLDADKVATPAVSSIASFQAARFAEHCRIFAPVYRQFTLPVGVSALGLNVPGIIDNGYADVESAWQDYLRNDNHGRGVVLISHSQGSFMLRKLIRSEIDPNPAVRDKLVGAVMLGGNVTVKRGEDRDGDFHNIPICTSHGQYGCVVAYSSNIVDPPLSLFGNSDLDLGSDRFGLPHGARYEVACTDPATLTGEVRPVGVTVPSKPYALGLISLSLAYTTFPESLPTSRSTWTVSRGRGVGECRSVNGYHQYHITMTTPQPVNEIPGLDSHLLDFNFGLDRLVRLTQQWAGSWLAAH